MLPRSKNRNKIALAFEAMNMIRKDLESSKPKKTSKNNIRKNKSKNTKKNNLWAANHGIHLKEKIGKRSALKDGTNQKDLLKINVELHV